MLALVKDNLRDSTPILQSLAVIDESSLDPRSLKYVRMRLESNYAKIAE